MEQNGDMKGIFVRVPHDIYKTFSTVCIDAGITKAEAIIKYVKYLRKFKFKRDKQLLDEFSNADFAITNDKPF